MVWVDIFDKKSSISMEFVKSLRSGLWRSRVGMQIKRRKKDVCFSYTHLPKLFPDRQNLLLKHMKFDIFQSLFRTIF